MKTRLIAVPIYNDQLYVHVGPATRIRNLFVKRYGEEATQRLGNWASGKYIELGEYSTWDPRDKKTYAVQYHVWVPSLQAGPVVHELFHFTVALLESRGLECTSEHDEAHAYLLAYLVEAVVREFGALTK